MEINRRGGSQGMKTIEKMEPTGPELMGRISVGSEGSKNIREAS